MPQVFLPIYLAVVLGAFVGCLGESATPSVTAPGTHLGHAVLLVGSGRSDSIVGPWPLEVVATVARDLVRPGVRLAGAGPGGGGQVLCVHRLRASTIMTTVTYCCKRLAPSPRP